jgi:hypothetical protein
MNATVLTPSLRGVTIPVTYFFQFSSYYTFPKVTKEGLYRGIHLAYPLRDNL